MLVYKGQCLLYEYDLLYVSLNSALKSILAGVHIFFTVYGYIYKLPMEYLNIHLSTKLFIF